jgi:hypothetical protein
MRKTRTVLLVFAFFAILAINTAFHPFSHWDIQSGPLLILDSIINTVLVWWLGETLSAILLAVLAVIVPVMMLGGKAKQVPAQTTSPAAAGRATTAPRPQPRQTFGRR